MKTIAFDTSKNLNLYLRRGMNGVVTLNFFESDGTTPFDLTPYTFEFSSDFTLSVTKNSDNIVLTQDSEDEVMGSKFFWALVETSTVQTWLCGWAFFTSSISEEQSDEVDISVDIGDQIVNISLTVGGVTGGGSETITGEIPAGLINGTNTVYTLSTLPKVGSVKLFWNGVRMTVGVDYTISGVTITTTISPVSFDTLLVDFELP